MCLTTDATFEDILDVLPTAFEAVSWDKVFLKEERSSLRGCVGVGVIRHAYHLAQILRAPGLACLDDDACISHDFVVGSQADSCRFYSEATLPENRAAQTCYGHCGHPFSDRQ